MDNNGKRNLISPDINPEEIQDGKFIRLKMNVVANSVHECGQNEFLKIDEAAKLINIKISRIRNLVFSRKIPFIKVGATVRFSRGKLISWMESKSQGVIYEQ